MRKNVVILGAGVSGLAAAIKCKNLGYHVTLIEKSDLCSHLGGGIDIHPNGVKVLFSLGLEKRLRELTLSNLRRITISNANGQTIHSIPLSSFEKNSHYPLMSFLRQDLLKALFEKAKIDKLYEKRKCTDIFIKERGVEIQLEGHNHRIFADILIGADGINSITRKKILPNVKKHYLGHISIGGLVPSQLFRHNYIHGLRRTCVVFPCSKECCHTVMFMPQPEGFLSVQKNSFEEKAALLRGWSKEADILLDHLHESHRFAVESYEIPPLEFHAQERIFLVGDAAHALSPLGALATSLALENVENLSNCLLNAPTISQAAQLYNRVSLPIAKKYWDFSHRFLIPTITTHQLKDYVKRMDQIKQAPPHEVFKPLIYLTQEHLPLNKPPSQEPHHSIIRRPLCQL